MRHCFFIIAALGCALSTDSEAARLNTAFTAFDRAVESRALACAERFPNAYPHMLNNFDAWRKKHHETIQAIGAQYWRAVEARLTGDVASRQTERQRLEAQAKVDNDGEGAYIKGFSDSRARIVCDGENADLASDSDTQLLRALHDATAWADHAAERAGRR